MRSWRDSKLRDSYGRLITQAESYVNPDSVLEFASKVVFVLETIAWNGWTKRNLGTRSGGGEWAKPKGDKAVQGILDDFLRRVLKQIEIALNRLDVQEEYAFGAAEHIAADLIAVVPDRLDRCPSCGERLSAAGRY